MSNERWFAPGPADGLSKLLRYNHATAFVDAEEYFADLRRQVLATSERGLVCWIGFEVAGTTPMLTMPLCRRSRRSRIHRATQATTI